MIDADDKTYICDYCGSEYDPEDSLAVWSDTYCCEECEDMAENPDQYENEE